MTAVDRRQVVAVARAHDTITAAEWAGVSAPVVNRWRREAGDTIRGRGRPSTVELAVRAVRPSCPCPRCGPITRARVEALLADGYGYATVARLAGAPLAAVRAVAVDLERLRRPPAGWTPAGAVT